MDKYRKVIKTINARKVREGAGVLLHRVIGFDTRYDYDPFLLLDDFRSDHPEEYVKGFPWHPHRGIETITYVTRGTVKHEDSMGNKGEIGAGEIQWMTAGSGIYHQEMPEGDKDGFMYGFQLWANLPAKDKMTGPRYRGYSSGEIPLVRIDGGGEIKVLAGTYKGTAGPVKDVVTSPEYFDISLPANSDYVHETRPRSTVLVYVFEGSGFVMSDDENEEKEVRIRNRVLAFFDRGERIRITSGNEGIRFLFISGMPIKEQIAWYGPIVMNTKDELDRAYKELENGTFIKS